MMGFNDDERAPYVSMSAQCPVRNAQSEDTSFIPVVPIIREMYKEDKEKMYVKNACSQGSLSEMHGWGDLYAEYFGNDDEPSSHGNDSEEDVPSSSFNDESSSHSEEEDFDPLTNDPLFRSVAQKFAYV